MPAAIPDPPPAPPGVLVTRPEPGASETARRVAALGLLPIVAPLLTVATLPARLPRPGRVQAVVAASGNAAAGLPAAFHAVTLLTVGDATAARARAAGFATIHSAGADATALADLAARRCDPAAGPLLLAAGRGQGAALAAALRARGFRVLRRAVYAAAPVPVLPPAAAAAIAAGSLRAAMFFSAETARALATLLDPTLHAMLRQTDALAIGRPAAVALGALPWRRVRVAARPTQDAMLALLR